jgi:hypothetical protein
VETGLVRASQNLLKLYPISILSSPPNHHQANGRAETSVGLLKNTITKIIYNSEKPGNKDEWDVYLPLVLESLNNMIMQPSLKSRNQIHYGSMQNSMFQNHDDLNEVVQIQSKPVKYTKPKLSSTKVEFKHKFVPGDLVTKKSYSIPAVGQKAVFTPKTTPNLYKILETPPYSNNIIIKCLKTGSQLTVRYNDLQILDPLHFLPSMGSTDMYDPTLLEEIKNIKRVPSPTNILGDILSSVPLSDSELEPGQFSDSITDIPPPPDTNSSPESDPLLESLGKANFCPVQDNLTSASIPPPGNIMPQSDPPQILDKTLNPSDHNFYNKKSILKNQSMKCVKKNFRVKFDV